MISPLLSTLGALLSELPLPMSTLGCALAFASPLVFLLPLFGARRLPIALRLPLCLVLALALAPALALPGASSPKGPQLLAQLMLHFAAGVGSGLLLKLPFEAARGLGGFAAQGLGGNSAAAPLGDCLELLVVQLELSPVVVGLFLVGLRQLYAQTSRLGDPRVAGRLFERISGLGLGLSTAWDPWELLLRIAAPLVLALVLADLLLGVAGRMLPQLPLFFLGQPLKIALVCSVVGLCLPGITDLLLGQQLHLLEAVTHLP